LERVLDSLKKQTFKDFDIIISEDAEHDEMKAFINSYPFENSWQHLTQEDLGWRKNRALNRAILAAKSDYLVLIDGDCLLHPCFIEQHLSFSNRNLVLGGKRIKLNEQLSHLLLEKKMDIQEVQPYLINHFLQLKKNGFSYCEEGLYIPPKSFLGWIPRFRKMHQLKGCNMSFSKKAILHINGFDEDYIRPAIGEDIDLTWRFLKAGYQLGSVRNLAVQYHLYHKENWNNQDLNIRMMKEKQDKDIFRCINGIRKQENQTPTITR